MGMSDAFLAYAFWVKTGRPWDIHGLRSHFSEKKMKQQIKKHAFNTVEYENLQEAVRIVEEKLNKMN